jgi:hypothetical protein
MREPSPRDVHLAAGLELERTADLERTPGRVQGPACSTASRSSLPVEWHDCSPSRSAGADTAGRFRGHSHTYLELDGFKYWVVGRVINRERLDEEPA